MKMPFLICLLLGSFFSFAAMAQTSLTGMWEGKLEAGVSLRVVLHISTAAGDSLHVTMDSPDQGVKGISADNAYRKDDSVIVSWKGMRATFKGAISDTVLAGNWLQGGGKLLLTLRKTEKPTELYRPQTPKPPFPYKSIDLTFQNKENGITYGATLTLPEGKWPFPALLLLTGSGPQNRDEEVFGHKPFAVIADYLTRIGYAVLRVDDRGMGQTTGDAANTTEKALLEDATTAFEFLKSRPEVNKKKLGILGHSQGGMTAQIMGAQRKDVAFLILMAAPGMNGVDMMTVQNEKVLRSMGIKEAAASRYASLYLLIATALSDSKDSASASRKLLPIVSEWRKETDKPTVLTTTGIYDSSSQAAFVATFAVLANDPAMLDLYRFDPAPYLKQITAKVLALNGSEDIQVVSGPNMAAMKSALSQGVSRGYELKELPGLNHLFQKCTKCTIQEYGQLEETLNPALLEAIGHWLNK